MIKEKSVQHLVELSRIMQGKFVSSPVWDMLKTEQFIIDWMEALQTVENELQQKQIEETTLDNKQ